MRIVIGTALLALIGATPVAAASSSAADRMANKVVCKNQAKTGTRFAKRICRTHKDWETIREANRREAEEMFKGQVVETRRE